MTNGFQGPCPPCRRRAAEPAYRSKRSLSHSIVLEACADQKTATVRAALTAAFRRYGLPRTIITDNGSPWGDGLAGALVSVRDAVIALAVALIGVLAKQLSPAVRDLLFAAKIEQLLSRAADYGIVAVAGAVKGKTMDVKIANEVIAEAINYAIVNAPELAARLGDTLRPKIVARLAPYFPAEANAEALKATVTPYP